MDIQKAIRIIDEVMDSRQDGYELRAWSVLKKYISVPQIRNKMTIEKIFSVIITVLCFVTAFVCWKRGDTNMMFVSSTLGYIIISIKNIEK